MSLDFPANPTDGQVYGSYVWSSSKGVWLSREESAAVTITSPIAPTTGTPGDLWFNSSTGILFTYYSDGTSAQWVEVVSSSVLDISDKANIDSPTFTGTVSLPSTTSIGSVSSTELGYVDGVTSSIQTQLNGKAASSHTHAASDITSGQLASARMPSGSVLQAQVVRYQGRPVFGFSGDTIISYLNVPITPKSSNSLLIAQYHITGEVTYNAVFRAYRDGSLIGGTYPGYNTEDGNRWSGIAVWPYDTDLNSTPNTVFFQYFALSGNTNPTTMQIAIGASANESPSFYMNRSIGNATLAFEIGVSYVVVWEVAL